MFQLSREEVEISRSQNVTLNNARGKDEAYTPIGFKIPT